MSELRPNETVKEHLESCGLLESTTKLCIIVATYSADKTKKDIFCYRGYGDKVLGSDGSDVLNTIIMDFNGCYDPLTSEYYFEFII